MRVFQFIVFFLVFGATLKAQELPPVQNYLPQEYLAGNQNWGIAQDDDRNLYFANNAGLLTYNGSQFKLYNSPNSTILRSVNARDDKIFTGAYMDFGYWQKDEKGLLNYTSLVKELNIDVVEDEQFWNILFIDKYIAFQSLNNIYLYDSEIEQIQLIAADDVLLKSYKLENTIFYQVSAQGLYKIEGGKPKLLFSSEVYLNDVIVSIHYNASRELILLTQNNGFFVYDAVRGVKKWEVQSNEILARESVYSAIPTNDGELIVGTVANGLYKVDTTGAIVAHLNQSKGLANNTVLSTFEDMDGNAWLGLDNGISVVNFHSPFRVFQDVEGELGTVYTSAVFEDHLYLGTNQGLFSKPLNDQDDFKLIPGTRGQVWKLKEVKGTLFCGHNLGTFIIHNDAAHMISYVTGAWDFKTISWNDDLIVQGNYSGLFVLQRKGDTWELRNKLEGFDISSRFFEIYDQQTILVSHEYKGVFKLDIAEDLQRVNDYQIISEDSNGAKSGLVKYQGEILYGYNNGILKYDAAQEKLVKDTIYSQGLLENTEYVSGKLIADDKQDLLWGFTQDGLVYFGSASLDQELVARRIAFPSQKRKDMQGYENLVSLGENQYLLGFAGGYSIFDLEDFDTNSYTIQLQSVENKFRESEAQYFSTLSEKDFEAKLNNPAFTFSVPVYGKFQAVEYQYRLLGLYENWSPWTTETSAYFENLPHGDYTFEVRARVNNQLTENTIQYSFAIARPWYISILAIILYVIAFVALLILFHLNNRRYYNRQREKLIERNKRELEMANVKNEGELIKLRNEKLQDDVESKNRELAVSTMSMVKKNELLNKIKKDLLSAKNKDDIRGVIKNIDKSLNNNKDWEFFEEAFNNADTDFLHKIKDLHPNLTPSDLKLCAYLRLNLSSKEIAPLLNISVRSVEIKRYRLRKKMELEHEASLTDYILSI